MKRGVNSKVGHRWTFIRGLPWLKFCWRCGLVFLRNSLTEQAIKDGCFDEE